MTDQVKSSSETPHTSDTEASSARSVKRSTKTGYALGGVAVGAVVGAVLGVAVHQNYVQEQATLDPQGAASDGTRHSESEYRSLQRLDSGAESFSNNMAFNAVDSILEDKSVVLVVSSDVSNVQKQLMLDLLDNAKAKTTGQVVLHDKFTDAGAQEYLRAVFDTALPAKIKPSSANQNTGFQAGQILSSALLVNDQNKPILNQEDRDSVLSAFEKEGFISRTEEKMPAAQSVIILTGSGQGTYDDSGYAAGILSDMALALSEPAQSAVFGSWSTMSQVPDALQRVRNTRSTEISTVDNLYQAAGRVTALRALASGFKGQTGEWGYGPGVTGPYKPL